MNVCNEGVRDRSEVEGGKRGREKKEEGGGEPVSAAASFSDGCLNSSSGFILAY